MEINRNTKIGKLIKENKEVIDVMVSISSKFERLRNPVMRKIVASRTSIKQAAKVGKVEIKTIAEKLAPLGFVFVEEEKESEEEGVKIMPLFMKDLKEEDREILDVRQDIQEGKDPLRKIMSIVRNLPEEKVLEIINSFEPTPLIAVMEKKGYEYFVDEVGDDEVHAFFKLKQGEEKGDLAEEVPDMVDEETLLAKIAEFGDKVETVDVRKMLPPMPLMTILERMSGIQKGYVLSVQHKRIPVFLFGELRQRNYGFLICQKAENDVKLAIWDKN